MKKNLIAVMLLALVCAGTLFAQEKAKNTITGGIYGATMFLFVPEVGASLEYERILLGNNMLGVALEAGGGLVFGMFPSYNVLARARFYPFSKVFFIQSGIGYRNVPSWEHSAFLVPAEVGWKVFFGESGGLTLVADVGLMFSFGTEITKSANEEVKKLADAFDFLPGIRLGLRLGYSF